MVDSRTATAPLGHQELLDAATELVPLLERSARAAEEARRPLDEVIDAVRESGLFAMMVPTAYGGHEADLDTFFEVTLTLSKADPAMGWLLGFYIEHNLWFCGFAEEFQKELFRDTNYRLAPASINAAAGAATRVDGGYRLDGRWQWGTGIVHADWVIVGAILREQDVPPGPYFFAMPREDVEAIDTWHMLGLCGTGSWDIKVENLFVPEARAASMLDLVNASGEAARLFSGPLYHTPILPVLAFAAGIPLLGAAHKALASYQSQIKAKIEAGSPTVGGSQRDQAKPAVAARAALSIEAAELLFRSVLADVLEHRSDATIELRTAWMARISHGVFMCREAVQDIASVTGASGGFLDNPIQRALRDVTTGANHVVFDRELRYADYGRILLGQPIQTLLA